MTKKYTFNFDDELIEMVDAFAAAMHITRTSAMSVLTSQAIHSINLINGTHLEKTKDKAWNLQS